MFVSDFTFTTVFVLNRSCAFALSPKKKSEWKIETSAAHRFLLDVLFSSTVPE